MMYTNPLIAEVMADIAHSQRRNSLAGMAQNMLSGTTARGGFGTGIGTRNYVGAAMQQLTGPAGRNLVQIAGPNGTRVTVNSRYARQFSGLMNDLWNSGYRFKSVQGYNYRNIAGTNRLSKHATGEAIDIDPGANRGTRLGGGGARYGYFNPNIVIPIIRKWGLDWGGLWKGSEDPMHFSTGG
jgi:hypothetical protein